MSSDSSSASQHASVAEKWLTAFQTFLLGLFLYLAPPTFAVLILYAGLHLAGFSDNGASDWLQNVTFGQFLYVAITEGIVLTFLWFLLKYSKISLADIGVKWPKFSHLQYVVLGLVVYFALYICISGSILACQKLGISQEVGIATVCNAVDFDQEQQIGFDKNISGIDLMWVFVSLVVLPPIVEEILFRGYLYNRLRKAFSIIGAGFLVSLLFGIAHLQIDTGNIPLWVAAIDTFILSVVLVYIREKTGTIWSGVCIHALKNFIAFALLFKIFS